MEIVELLIKRDITKSCPNKHPSARLTYINFVYFSHAFYFAKSSAISLHSVNRTNTRLNKGDFEMISSILINQYIRKALSSSI